MKKLLILLFVAFVTTSAFAEDVTFTGGGGDNKFSNPKNWSNGKVPGQEDNVKNPKGNYMVIDSDVKVNSIENNGVMYATDMDDPYDSESNKTIQVNNFVNNNEMILGEGSLKFKNGEGSKSANWVNNGQINGEGGFAVGNYYENFEGSVVNNGDIGCGGVRVGAYDFTNGKKGNITTGGGVYLTTKDRTDNQGSITTSGSEGAGRFEDKIHLRSKGDVDNSGEISTKDGDSNGHPGDIYIRGNNVNNSGTIKTGNGVVGSQNGGKIKIVGDNELETSGSITTGDGAGYGASGGLEMHAKNIHVTGGTLKIGKTGKDATHTGYMYLVAKLIDHYGWFPSSKTVGGASGKSGSIAADESAPFPVYFHARDITYSGDKDAAEVQHITFNCENIVFKNMETDALKSFGYVTIQYKEGGSADFSQLTNPNSINTEAKIEITNSNITEPPGGYLSVFNTEPTLVDPVNGWSFVTEIVNVRNAEAGLSGDISFDLFNMYFLEQEVQVNFHSTNNWAETSSITIDIDYLDFGELTIPFTIPADAQKDDTDKFYYSFTYNGQTTNEIELQLLCLDSKTIDKPVSVTLESPINNAEKIELSPTLTWKPSQDADYYMIEFATDDQFEDVLVRLIMDEHTLLIDMELEEGTDYYWHVYAVNAGGFGDWSETWSFRTIALAPATAASLIQPANGATEVKVIKTELIWNSVEGADGYTLTVTVDGNVEINFTDLTDTNKVIDLELYETEYTWTVQAWNEGGEGPVSETWAFITEKFVSVEELIQKYSVSVSPNPTSATATISYSLAQAAQVKLTIFDEFGNTIQSSNSQTKAIGEHQYEFNTEKLSSGVYYYSIRIGSEQVNGKIVKVK
jgi:type IX secretion system substrate protein/fibronectin type III domain protein